MSDTNGTSAATSSTQNTSQNQSSNPTFQENKVQEQQPLLAEQQKPPSTNQIFNSTLNTVSSNPILPNLQPNDIQLQQLQSQLAQSALLQLIQTQPLLKQQLQTQFVQDTNMQTNQPPFDSPIQPVDAIKPLSPSMPTLSHLVNINRMPHNKTIGALGRQANFLVGSANNNNNNNNKPVSKRKEEFQYYYNKCMRTISHSINIIKAVTMRIVFSLHSLIAIVYVYLVREDEWYFVNVIGVVFMLIELFITVIRRKGREPRWFFPCFFIYICTMIPPIWFVELHRIDQSNARRKQNITDPNPIENLLGLSQTLGINESLLNANLSLDIATIAVGLEISLLMLVILGRWFLPKGNISRSTLSQLLLVYMSLASDIVDLLSLLNETQVQESKTMSYFTLAIFSWSLFQFSLNLIVTRGRSFQSVSSDDQNDDDDDDEYLGEDDPNEYAKNFTEKLQAYSAKNSNLFRRKKFLCWSNGCFRFDMLDSEIWSILITVMFQDGPFFALRLTAVIKFNVRTFVTMFFTCKNAIILFLQFYRLSAICTEANHNQSDALNTNKADALASLNAAASQLDKFVLLSFTQNMMMKNSNSKSSKHLTNPVDQTDKKQFTINPILLRSTLSKNHSYAVVLTPNLNLNTACCQCDCHPKESFNYF